MNPLKKLIIEKIKRFGPISFEEFMEMCLYYPELGYYMREDIKIGRFGDYYTSPHLGPFFGAIIALQLYEMWCEIGRPCTFTVVEMGAGMGYLSCDILTFLSRTKQGKLRDFFDALSYRIIDLSPAMIRNQKILLQEFTNKITWHNEILEIPEFVGCIFSNELIDAFPVKLIIKDVDFYEILVDVDREEFIEIRGNASTEILDYFKRFNLEIDEGYKTEANLRIKDWFCSISKVLKKGFILTIDYGYNASEYYGKHRNRGTLLCYYKHTVNDNPYINIGEQDITSHVNFSALKEFGQDHAIETILFTSQRDFLLAMCDLMLKLLDEREIGSIIKGAKLNLIPGFIGDTHKVLIQKKGIESEIKLTALNAKNRLFLL